MADMLATRNTLVAVAIESTPYEYETIVDADFMPILDSFAHSPGYDTVENKEMSGSLDKKPARRSTQTGTVTVPVYLKNGGDNTAPHFDPLLRANFDTPTNPFSGSDMAVVGNAALVEVLASPAPTDTQFDIDVAAAFLAAGDVILVDVSATSTPNWEMRTVYSATFNTDHETVVLTEALSVAPTATHNIQLISRVDIETSPGLTVGDVILVDVGQGATEEFEATLVLAVTGTTTQTVKVWPYFSQEPLDENVVVGGFTYKMKSSGHAPLTVSVFLDCIGQDGMRYNYAGCRPKMKLQGAETGSIAELLFEMEAVKWNVEDTGTNLTTLGLSPDKGPTHDAPICVGAVICLGSQRTLIHTQKLELDLGYAIARRRSMIPSSGTRSTRFNERAVTGVFDLDLVDKDQYTAWGAGETAPLLVQLQDDNQTIVIIAPYIKRTNVQDADSDGIRTQDITWQADPDETLGPVYFAFFKSIA